MAQSLSKILLHIIFSTKNRSDSILYELEEKLHAYLATSIRSQGSKAYRIGGTSNHIHIACTLHRTIASFCAPLKNVVIKRKKAGNKINPSRNKVRISIGPSSVFVEKQPQLISRPLVKLKIIAAMNIISKPLEIHTAPGIHRLRIRKHPNMSSSQGNQSAVRLMKTSGRS